VVGRSTRSLASMSTNVPAESHARQVAEESRLLYNASVTEIASYKQYQWNVTNYVLLIDAGIVSASHLLGEKSISSEQAFVLCVLAAISTVAGCWAVTRLSASILLRRQRLTHIRLHRFTEEFRNSWRIGKTADESPDSPTRKRDLKPFFWAVQGAALIVVTWLLIYRANAG
jgi:hypothetical protein